ncbi:MAG: hypothetical protein J5J06_15925 [Phycisphaerae bacterium]|nr:hypothetical protein [Phycisphaerae bacterium]
MKLTEKDREFLYALRRLMESRDLSVELKRHKPSYMILRGTYGEKIFKTFRMSRQGVRWRFHRVFNDAYVAAFESILLIETTFGTHLREHAVRISRERHVLRQELGEPRFVGGDAVRESAGGEGRAPGGQE